ncbi:hypothetical protein IWQ56_001277 [Coemansia nantahalensis]|nr:hypothetical protein IWQ56_001277 [Coemansia nantahalensis]
MTSLSNEPPTRVYVDDDRAEARLHDYFIPAAVDRTLLCRAVFGAEHKFIRICAPRRTGCSFNLELLAKFANVLTVGDMPPPTDTSTRARPRKMRAPPLFDRSAAHDARMHQFRDSLLLRAAPDFVAEHLARYPVIHLDLPNICPGTLGDFNRCMVKAVINSVLSVWANALDALSADYKQREQRKALFQLEEEWTAKLDDDEAAWKLRGDAASTILSKLVDHLSTLFDAPMVVLIDEYDVPLLSTECYDWAPRARQSYLQLLRCVLADNAEKLFKAVLVGAYPLALDDSGLDTGSMVTVEVASGRPSRAYTAAGPVHSEALALIPYMFGLAPAEVRALTAQRNLLASREHNLCARIPEDVMVQHCFSPSGCASGVRCSMGDVLNLFQVISKVDMVQMLRSNAFSEEAEFLTADMVRERRMDMVRLATVLLCEYDADTAGDSVVGGGAGLCYNTTISTPLGEAFIGKGHNAPISREDGGSEGDDDLDVLSMNRYLSDLVCYGHAAVWADNKLRIPNGRFRRLWEYIRQVATFGDNNAISQSSARTGVVTDLHHGRVFGLLGLMQFCARVLRGNHGYSEESKLEAMCCYIASFLTHPRYLAADRANIEYDHTFFRELHNGRTSWEIVLHPFGRHLQRLVILFEFARILPDDTSDATAIALSMQALQTIADSGRAQSYLHCDRRLDVGVAFGQDMIAVSRRFWEPVGDGCPVAKSDVSLEECEKLHSGSTQGWQDGLGWMTAAMSPSSDDDGDNSNNDDADEEAPADRLNKRSRRDSAQTPLRRSGRKTSAPDRYQP